MSKPDFNQPLTQAALDSLRRAGKIARKGARATGVPLVVWKDGRVVHVPVGKAATKSRRRAATRPAAR
jgi:hypothetical protein